MAETFSPPEIGNGVATSLPLSGNSPVQGGVNDSDRESEFNSPAEMFARAVFLVAHGALAAGLVSTPAGLLSGEVKLVLSGLAFLVVAWAGRAWLRSRGELAAGERALERITAAAPPLDDGRVAELIRLLEQWEALEQKRGSPAFDPWAVQAVRHDIRILVERDPALEQLFTALRRAA